MESTSRITDEQELKAAVEKALVSVTADVKREVGTLESQYTLQRHKQRIGVLVIAAGFLLPNLVIFSMEILAAGVSYWWSNAINILVFLASIVIFGYLGGNMFMAGVATIRKFHGSVDTLLFAKTFELLGVKGTLIEHSAIHDERVFPDTKIGRLRANFAEFSHGFSKSPEAIESLDLLRQSELITEPFNLSHVDNVFEIHINGTLLHGAELDIKNETGAGKSRQVKKIFKGFFVSYELPNTLDGKTFVSTEGDEHGFGHRTFWNAVNESGAAETTLEWNAFEELLHVATTDRVEARYILTPSFMNDLYDWWKPKSTNIRISFIKNRFYMIFPDHQARLNESVDKIDEKEVREYMLTLATPLLHIVRLTEGVRMT